VLLPILSAFIISGCKKDSIDQPSGDTGQIGLNFKHFNNGNSLRMDTMMYENEAGNEYLVNEIQYFISDVTVIFLDGTEKLLDEWKDIHYVDTDIQTTHSWDIYDKIEAGKTIIGISFTFGINEEKNQSLMFTNPPESLMFWPEYLGGGYHYMKLNGKWKADDGIIKPFDFHLGIGQIYDNEGNITGFIQNYFTVDLPLPEFKIESGKRTIIELVMNIENWFRTPNTYNHDQWGGDIMQKQEAMILGIENGHNVFTIGSIE
jgi:hypothetical protein